MASSDNHTATVLLNQTLTGNAGAADDLFAIVYDELRDMARGWLNGDAARLTLRPTAVVHEAYLKLVGSQSLDWNSRTHFRAIAARAMHQVLADQARAGNRAKRGGGWDRVTLSGIEGDAPMSVDEVNDALRRLAQADQRAATVVVLRYFGGLTDREVADQLGVTDRTVRNDWRMARAWLRTDLEGNGSGR